MAPSLRGGQRGILRRWFSPRRPAQDDGASWQASSGAKAGALFQHFFDQDDDYNGGNENNNKPPIHQKIHEFFPEAQFLLRFFGRIDFWGGFGGYFHVPSFYVSNHLFTYLNSRAVSRKKFFQAKAKGGHFDDSFGKYKNYQ
jgi:hypothetical protein